MSDDDYSCRKCHRSMYVPDGMDPLDEDVRFCDSCAADEIERLRAIVDLLKKTKDCVPVVPHHTTRLWYIHPRSGVVYERTYEADMDDARSHCVDPVKRNVDGDRIWISVEDCYSTREAAVAARKEQA